MSHDIWSSFATTELAKHLGTNPNQCFNVAPVPAALSIYVGGRDRKTWPVEDGAIVIEHALNKYHIAVEFKRQNEGLHGILTALGQSLAYINKGYKGAVLILPKSYASYAKPGNYIANVIDNTIARHTIGVFTYDDPDTTSAMPFSGKLSVVRPLQVDTSPAIAGVSLSGVTETQWMHVREGSSTPSAFYKYLQTAKNLSLGSTAFSPTFSPALARAVARVKPGVLPARYLSYTTSGPANFHDEVWRRFWFEYIATHDVLKIWKKVGATYVVNAAKSKIFQSNGISLVHFFSARSDSIKNKLVKKLNDGTLTEDMAWDLFAKNVHKRAHSFREDIDSGLEGIGLLGNDGKPLDLGYRFVDACERTGDPHSAAPLDLLKAALLKNGEFGALLHYIFKLSEEKFRSNPLEFTVAKKFNSVQYMEWLESELETNLKVLRKVSLRGGTTRKPLQGELAILGNFDLIPSGSKRFRTGVGLAINWPAVQEALAYPI